jgi:hypothetical protein
LILLCKKRKRNASGYSSGCKKIKDALSHISSVAELRVSCDEDLKNYLHMTDECFKVGSFVEASH